MKALVTVAAMGLALSMVAQPARGAEPVPATVKPDSADAILDRSGNVLVHPRITDFDGAEFTVEHDGGIARVPYSAMPLMYRRFFTPDPESAKKEAERRQKLVEDAQRQAILEVQRGILERQMRAKVDAKRAEAGSGIRYGPTYDLPTAYTTREANDPAKPMRFEVSLKQGVLTELFPLGGPLISLELVAVDEDAIIVRKSRRERAQPVQVRHGREAEGQNLTWLYSDKQGATVYWLDTLRRPADGGIFVIEYAPQSPLRPGSPIREQIPQAPRNP